MGILYRNTTFVQHWQISTYTYLQCQMYQYFRPCIHPSPFFGGYLPTVLSRYISSCIYKGPSLYLNTADQAQYLLLLLCSTTGNSNCIFEQNPSIPCFVPKIVSLTYLWCTIFVTRELISARPTPQKLSSIYVHLDISKHANCKKQ